jgi:ABC-type branched-subunit amino acid transport system ATPase component
MVGRRAVWREERRVRAEMADLLAFIGLADYARMPAGELSGGQRRLLALGRAMAMRPKLLMLDEPAAGLSPVNVDKLLDTVMALKERYGLTVIIIEHILKVVMDTCDVVSVLEHGEKIAEGPPAAIKDNHRVIEAYLGKEMDDAEVRAYLRAP